MDKNNCKMRWETIKLWDLVCLILEVWQYRELWSVYYSWQLSPILCWDVCGLLYLSCVRKGGVLRSNQDLNTVSGNMVMPCVFRQKICMRNVMEYTQMNGECNVGHLVCELEWVFNIGMMVNPMKALSSCTSHRLSQCLLVNNKVLWHSYDDITGNAQYIIH